MVARQNLPRFRASDILTAVEIVSPGTRRTDRVTKPFEYAEAGIQHYWLIELDDPATLTAYTLVDGEYEVVAQSSEEVTIFEPARMTVNVQQLVESL
jgi:Uma2 family endonuclease